MELAESGESRRMGDIKWSEYSLESGFFVFNRRILQCCHRRLYTVVLVIISCLFLTRLRTATVVVFYRLLLADSGVAETVTEIDYAPVSALCSRPKSSGYKIRNRNHAKYSSRL